MSLFNKTTRLIMPMAFYEKGIKSNNIIDKNFVNAYIGDVERPELDDKLLLVYKNSELVFDIPKDLQNDYWKIICSQYQEVDPNYIKFVIDFWDHTYDPPKGPYDEFEIFEEVYNMGVY